MAEAYIIDAVRTPIGRRGGGLAAEHPADLGAHVLKGLVDRTGVDAGAVETSSSAAATPSDRRPATSPVAAGWPPDFPSTCPGVTIDRQCGSSQQAVHFASQGVMSGTADLIIAGGVQNMSQIPISSAMTLAEPLGFNRPVLRLEGLGRALRHAGGLAVSRLGDDRREVGHHARGHGRVRVGEPPARDSRHRRGPLQERDPPLRRARLR